MEPSPGAAAPAGDAHSVFDTMRDLGHGRIENLSVVADAPRITEKTKLFRRYRVGRPDPAPSAPPPPHAGRRPHPQHVKLLARCRAVGDGVIERVEVADGVPVYWSPA